MKKIISIILLVLMIFIGCEKKIEKSIEVVSREYRAIWSEDYNFDTPILIDNLSDLKNFIEEHPEQFANENKFLEDYNEEFFKSKLIYIFIKSESSGSNNISAKGVKIEGAKLTLIINREVSEIGTADMAAWICLFEVNRSDIKDIKTVGYEIIEKN